MHLSLAPLHGFTESTFRNVYFRHFEGFDEVIAPFVSLTHGDKVTPQKVKELNPHLNPYFRVIPQILGNEPEDFIMLCKFLHDEWGYGEINWNLGCPIKGITRKKRGSGLLPHPDMLNRILEVIIPAIPQKLSVKMRLGLSDTSEFLPVIRVLNSFPLAGIIVHPRIGAQLYEGSVLLDEFEKYLPEIRQEVSYNGDINNFSDYLHIRNRFPGIKKIMLGRGVFANPFLPSMIKASDPCLPADAFERFRSYYYDLEEAEKSTRHFWIGKMKEFWKYFRYFVDADDNTMDELFRTRSENEWSNIVSGLIKNPN